MKASKVSVLAILFFFVIFMLIPAPQVQGALTANSWVTEIIGLSFTPYVVETDLDGNIYVNTIDNDVYKSTDQGSTWTKVLDLSTTDIKAFVLFCDSRGYIYTSHWDGDDFDTYRSIDDGESFDVVLNDHAGLWHMVEDSNGNLFVNTYSDSIEYVYNSTDSGATFNVFLNTSDRGEGGGQTHIHCVGIDIANDDVYVGMGDTDDRIMKYNGTWSNVTTEAESGNFAQPTDIWSDGSYVYFAPDGGTELWRMPSGGVWSQAELVLDLQYAPLTGANEAFEAVFIEGLHFMGTEEGQLWASWDGERWIKIFYTGATSESVFSISNRAPIYFTERDNGGLWRLNIQKEDLIHLFYEEFYARKGDLTNAESFVLEQPIWSGTNYVDLTNVVLTDVQASIKGLNRSNFVINAGFESGDKTGWTEAYAPVGVIRSDSPANGTYYYARNHSDANALSLQPRSGTVVNAQEGDLVMMSFYVKSNASDTDAFRVSYWTTGRGYLLSTDIDVTTSWVRHCYYAVHNDADLSGKWLFGFQQNFPLETCIDSFEWVILEAGIHLGLLSDDSIAHTERMSTGAFAEENQTTTDPTLTINSQTVSHSGSLANGTESSAISLSGTLTGAVEVSATISGSEQCILRLTGTRLFYEDGTIIESRTNDVLRGRYYGTFSPTASTNDFAVLTSLQANVTSVSETATSLTFTVDSPSGTTSTTKVYCAGKGEPKLVTGADSSSYDNGVLTVTVTHASSKTIKVSWGGQASGQYNLIVYVKKDGMPYLNALVSVDGEEKKTDLLGQAFFDLTTGIYFVTATVDQETKNKTVTVHDSTSIGFEFQTFQANQAPSIILEVAIVVVVGVVLWFFVLPMVWRRRR